MSTYRCTVTCQYLGRLWSPGELLESEAVPPSHFAPIAVQVIPEEAENQELREENQTLREKIIELSEENQALRENWKSGVVYEPSIWDTAPDAGQVETPTQQEQVEAPAQVAVQEAEPEKRGRTAAKK